MHHTNMHRLEKYSSDLPVAPMEIPSNEEKPTPLPTEGIRGITEIIGKAAELTSVLAEAMKSSPIQLGNVVMGNNATMPRPSQEISGLNADQIARLERNLNRPTMPASASKPSPEAASNPALNPKATPPAPAPTPSSQPTETMEPATKTLLKAKTPKVLLPKMGQIKISTPQNNPSSTAATDTMEPATKEILKATKKETFLEPATVAPYEESKQPKVILPTAEEIKLSFKEN
jgi:hypothetical protein